MVIIVHGAPPEGQEYFGPFMSEDDANSFGVKEFEGDFNWWAVELISPEPDFNDDLADNKATVLTMEEVEAILGARVETAAKLPKQIMIDLSRIPETA